MRVESWAVDSRSGQTGVLGQEACVVVRLLGARDLERQAEEGPSIRAIHHRGVGHEKGVSVSGGEAVAWSLVCQDFNTCSLWLPKTL